jgi:CrcB protein
LLLVGVGGFVGAVLRYWIGGYVQALSGSVTFPYGTLAVNVLGCLVIGFLAEMVETGGLVSPELRSLVLVGLLGALTTFSTFSHETWNLIRGGQTGMALWNVGGNVGFSLLAAWLGHSLATILWR